MKKNANKVEQYFIDLFDQIVVSEIQLNPSKIFFDKDNKGEWSIGKQTLVEALGGEDCVKMDKRLTKLIW